MAKERRKSDRRPQREAKEFEEYMLQLDRVTRVVKGGRRMRFRALVAIGNRNGKVGAGVGKANEVAAAVVKAVNDAKKNLITIPILNTTIPQEVMGKFGSGLVLLKPAVEGTGLIAGSSVRAVLESVGIQDILTKSLGASNPHDVLKATLNALQKLRSREEYAELRGKQVGEL